MTIFIPFYYHRYTSTVYGYGPLSFVSTREPKFSQRKRNIIIVCDHDKDLIIKCLFLFHRWVFLNLMILILWFFFIFNAKDFEIYWFKEKDKWIINYCIHWIKIFMQCYNPMEKGVYNNDETFQWLFLKNIKMKKEQKKFDDANEWS